MSALIESLETRVFLSGTPTAAVTLKHDGAALTAQVNLVGRDAVKAGSIARSVLNKAGVLKADKTILATFTKGVASNNAVLHKDVAAAVSLVNRDVTKLVAAENQLAHKPTNTTFQAKASAALTKLETDAPAELTLVLNASTALNSTDTTNLQALATANPDNATIVGDVNEGIAEQNRQVQTLQADATTAFSTDVNAVIALYAVN